MKTINTYLTYFLIATPLLCQNIQFSDMASLPEARSALTSANNGDNIYIVNGFGFDEQYTDEVFQYDINQNSWSILTSSTIPKRFASAGIVGDYLYVFNGVAVGGQINSAVEKIDLNNGSIQVLSNNPQPCMSAGVATWNNKIYSFGGELQPSVYSNKLYEYDPQIDTWSEIAEIPIAQQTEGEIVDGKLYVIGGYNGAVSDRIDIYDIALDTWESTFTMPIGVSAHATAIIGSKIYLVGDFSNLTLLAYFDTSDSSFQVLTSNLIDRRHCAAEGISGSLFAIGGNTTSSIESSIASVQKSDIALSTNQVSSIKGIKVYPNPANDFVYISGDESELLVTVYDVLGQKVLSEKVSNKIDVGSFNTGIYVLKLTNGKKTLIHKFIKN